MSARNRPASSSVLNRVLSSALKHGSVGRRELAHDAVVVRTFEIHDLALALDDEAHGHRLDAAGRKRRPYLSPQQGGKLETDQPVEHPPGLLRIDQIPVHLPGVLHGVQDSVLRDFVENDPPRFGVRQLQGLFQVPGDGLSFAVFIGSEPYGLRLFREFLQLADHFHLVGRNLVLRFESFGDIDAEALFLQVADMAVTGLHGIFVAEYLFYGLGLGGRFDDH